MKTLIAILNIAIGFLFFTVELYAQEKKDDKRLDISYYLGTGGRGSENRYGSTFEVPSVGMGLEYFLTPRISVEGQINYLPNIAYALSSRDWRPWGESDVTFVREDEKYRLLWDINLLFYTSPTESKRPIRLFLTIGTGYQYDRVESTYVSHTTLEQYKYGYGSFWFQGINFGSGLKVKIKGDWALRLLYKIHRLRGDELQTNRLVLGLSYRF